MENRKIETNKYNTHLYKGYKYITLENKFNNGHQGYVNIQKDHPLFKLHYGDQCPLVKSDIVIEAEMSNAEKAIEDVGVMNLFRSMFYDKNNTDNNYMNEISMQFHVHGGLTYSGISYWDCNIYDIDEVIVDDDVYRFMKLTKLVNKTGNELYLYYSKEFNKFCTFDDKECEENLNHKNYIAAKRVNDTYNIAVKELKKYNKKLELKTTDNLSYIEFGYLSSTNQFSCYENDWWFGWDCNHYGDYPEDFTEDRAKQECERLIDQFIDWTFKYYS